MKYLFVIALAMAAASCGEEKRPANTTPDLVICDEDGTPCRGDVKE